MCTSERRLERVWMAVFNENYQSEVLDFLGGDFFVQRKHYFWLVLKVIFSLLNLIFFFLKILGSSYYSIYICLANFDNHFVTLVLFTNLIY